MPTYRGSCHCQAVTFQIEALIDKVIECNCSICCKKGVLHHRVRPEQFTLLSGDDALGTYQFGLAKHHFCKVCGIHVFTRPRVASDLFTVNILVLDDFDLARCDPEVQQFNGREWEASYHKIAGDVVPRAAPADPESTNAPIASFTRHNGGWTVVFSFADPTLGIAWRLGESGDFTETGFLDTLDPRSRRRTPNPMVQMDADTPAQTIYVRYIDVNGNPQGPFPIRFDPITALVQSLRKILDMTVSSWLTFREFNGLLVYYTHLISCRCAIRQMRIGIDTTVPDQVIELPPCDMRDPHAIPDDVLPYMYLPPDTKFVSIELTFVDGSLSEVRTYRV